MWVVGLSGGIACGKSAVCRIFQAHGVPIVDCDKLAHDCLKKVRPSWRAWAVPIGHLCHKPMMTSAVAYCGGIQHFHTLLMSRPRGTGATGEWSRPLAAAS